MATNKETPSAGTPGETISIGTEPVYTVNELDELLSRVTAQIRSTNFNAANQTLKPHNGQSIRLAHLNSKQKQVLCCVALALCAALLNCLRH